MERITISRGRNKWYAICAFLFVLLLSSTHTYAQGNGVLVCNDLVQVSLDIDCEADINPDMILEGTYTNWSNYSVKISNVVGTVVNKVGVYTVTVTYLPNGNTCWGKISVEDKLPPQVENCPCAFDNDDPDCTFSCADLAGVLKGDILVPSPEVIENCGPYTTKVTDHLTDKGCQGKILKRTYIYTDQYGNNSLPCVSYYTFLPTSLAQILPPVKTVQLTCGAKTDPQSIVNFFKPTLGATVARTYAYPTINGQIVNEDGPCNLAATKTDSEILACGPTCTESKKIIRTWTVLDWCANQTASYVQIIKATDVKPPVVIAADVTASTDPWGCAASIYFPEPTTLKDDCSAVVDYRVEGPGGIQIVYHNESKKWLAIGVPKGNHTFFYKATDCCGNVGVDTVKVNVKDLVSPVAISKEFIVVSLTTGGTGNGQAKIYAASIDNGSHDGCTPVKLEIRRDEDKCNVKGNATYNDDGHSFDGSNDPNSPNYDPDQGAFVKFCCADLTLVENGKPYGLVKVWLRVWDDADMDGYFGSAGDNYNESWSWVRVEDKLPPTLQCPKDITIECYDDYKNVDKTGKASATYTCGPAEVEYTDSPNLNSCGQGTVRRKWFIKNNANIFCFQNIFIKPTPPGAITVSFPKDVTTDCKNLPGDQKPTYTGGPCNLLGHAVESDTFFFEDGACMKIINKYTVIDWCTYQPNSQSTTGIYSGIQIIKVKDDKAPILTCKDEMFEVTDNADVDNDGNKCELRGLKLINKADDNGDCASKWLKWTVLVDLNGDGTTDYEYSSYLNPNDNNFATDGNLNGIPDVYVRPTASNENIEITIPVDIAGSMRTHKVLWKVSDGCGNITSCNSTFMVVDKKKPTPYCISLSSALMQNGKVELWAKDFDKGSFDNCTDSKDLLFTFDNMSPVSSKINVEHYFTATGIEATKAQFEAGDAQRWVPSSKSSSKIFNCDDLGEINVDMTVWDAKGNYDYCTVKLRLLDNQGACNGGQSGIIAGSLKIKQQGIKEAIVKLNEVNGTMSKELTTDNSGSFNFTQNPLATGYTITASKNNDFLNGISTLDLVLIQRHILGISKFTDPLQVVASDINSDRKITAADLVELRKAILGVIPSFSNNNSWRFVDEKVIYQDPANPWPLKEDIRISNLDQDKIQQNFIGIKIGDVNGNVIANAQDQKGENRTKNTISFVAKEMQVTANEVYSINFVIEHQNVKGYQLALQTSGLEILDVLYEGVNHPEYQRILNPNEVRLSYQTREAAANATVLTLMVKATKNGNLSDMIDINKKAMASEAYAGEVLETTDIQVVFKSSGIVNEGFELLQNTPNPFNDFTTISFYLPQAQKATLTVFDINGKVLTTQTKNCNKGVNSMQVNIKDLNHSGVMYYQIESGDHTATKVMIGLK